MKNIKSLVAIIFIFLVSISCSKEDDIPKIEIDVQFTANKQTLTAGESVQFMDNSTGTPIAWEWTFEGGTPASSNEQNPKVFYLASGDFDVSLKVINANNNKEAISSDYIEVQPRTSPPFWGTLFIESDIITEDDPSTYLSIEAKGTGIRRMFDRRVNDWIQVEAYLFEVTFEGGTVEAQVNPEFTQEEAQNLSIKYSEIIGKMPAVLLKGLKTLWIHDGKAPFGGGNNNFLIHTKQGEEYEAQGIIEEVFLHEGAHTSLDKKHANATDWILAQNNDQTFISTYAKDFPNREDLSESFPCYFAIRFRPDRLTDDMKNIILATIPNRIQYFDSQEFDYSPWED